MPRRTAGLSLRARLVLLALLAVLVPASLIGLRFLVDRERQIAAATQNLSATAESLSAALDEKILGTMQLLYGLARARDLDTRDRPACSDFLSAVRDSHPQYTGILTVDPNGKLFCDSIKTGRDLDLNDRKYFQEVSRPGGTFAMEPVFGRLTGIAVLQIAYAVRDADGRLKFVLLASLNLEKFVHDRAEHDLEILLMRRDGQVLAWSPSDRRKSYIGTSIAKQPFFTFAAGHTDGAASEVAGIDGSEQVWAVSGNPAMANAGLLVLAGQSRSSLVAAADDHLREDLVTLTTVAVLLFLGAWLLVELGVRRPISRIAAMAQRLGGGDLAARIAPPFPKGELGELMQMLNGAAESLGRQNAAIKALNERVHQAQKMEAIGQLTGGVAHDFNNLLTVILGGAERLTEKLADDDALRPHAALVMAAAERGAGLTQSLLAFSRRQPLEPKPTDINLLLRRMEMLLRRTFGEQIELRYALGADISTALVDGGQLETAVLNLAINARDAMPSGGMLLIETADVALDATNAGRRGELTAGRYVMVAIADNGAGMSAEIQARAFEPFFTTKDVGAGTGLGLSMVYGFAKQSGGHAEIYSEPGQGTIVKLYLPCADAPAAAAATEVAVLERGRGETVLAVEDDDLVRAHVEDELTALGYRVVAATNAASALEILRSPAEIDVLFTDVIMPGGMSGAELGRAARTLRPGLNVLYTSGFTEDALMSSGRLDPDVLLLAKPYRRLDLAAKLRIALEGR
jgi:signal transduction histidine kinase